jgi:hypothetical protein
LIRSYSSLLIFRSSKSAFALPVLCCFGEHSRCAAACSDRFFGWVVLRINDAVEVKFWDVGSPIHAYATSKQAILATAMAFARMTPRLHFNAVEPGLNPTTALARDAGAVMRFMSNYIIPLVVPLLMPFIKVLSTPRRAARVITKVVINAAGQTGVYYDEGGHPILGSSLVRDPKLQDRVVAETRALLATITK